MEKIPQEFLHACCVGDGCLPLGMRIPGFLSPIERQIARKALHYRLLNRAKYFERMNRWGGSRTAPTSDRYQASISSALRVRMELIENSIDNLYEI
jgi:hypothetical protein